MLPGSPPRYETSTPSLGRKQLMGVPQPRRAVQREESAESPSKKSVLWDSLWSVDYSYESPPKKQ